MLGFARFHESVVKTLVRSFLSLPRGNCTMTGARQSDVDSTFRVERPGLDEATICKALKVAPDKIGIASIAIPGQVFDGKRSKCSDIG